MHPTYLLAALGVIAVGASVMVALCCLAMHASCGRAPSPDAMGDMSEREAEVWRDGTIR